MHCPKCKGYMKSIEFEHIQVERCTKCYGIWFDRFELQDLKVLSGSEVIDMGDPEVGKQQNQNTEAVCPRCTIAMIPESDKRQQHIRYERCPDCKGVYFDAGEFRDYKELTIGEFFKSIFNRKNI